MNDLEVADILLPILWLGVPGAIALGFYRVRMALVRDRQRQAIAQARENSKPENQIGQLIQWIDQAPKAYEVALTEINDIRKKNPQADLKAQEQKLELLKLAAQYGPMLKPVLPIFGKKLIGMLNKL